MKIPKVSVVLSSFNHSKFIREAIDSTLNQTFADFELIILDDGSSDNSWEIISQYCDPRIKAYRNETNVGGITGVNKVISGMTSGDYIAIHHSDDAWQLDKLEKQVAYLDANPEVGAVFTWVQIIDENGVNSNESWFNQENKTRGQWLNQLFCGHNYLNHPSVLIRKQCYKKVGLYRYGLAQTADAEMWSRVLLKFPIHIIQEKLTKHRLFSNQSNSSGPRIEVAIRTSNEWNVLRSNYIAIGNFDELIDIFPSLDRFRRPGGFDNKFLLAMACLHECKDRSAWQLGLNWLFELINDETHRSNLGKLYCFSDLDFIRLTAEFDVYDLRLVAGLRAKIANLTQMLDDFELQRAELEAVRRTRLYQLSEALRNDHPMGYRLKRVSWILGSWLVPRSIKRFVLPLLRHIQADERTSWPLPEPYMVRSPASLKPHRPKVVHAIANFMIGGSTRLVVDLIEHMGEDYDHEIITSFLPSPPAYVGVNVREFRYLNSSKPLLAYFSEVRPQLLHVHFWGGVDTQWYRQVFEAAKKYGCKIVENVNTPVSPFIADGVRRYVFVSDYIRREFGRSLPNAEVIHPGSDMELFSRAPTTQPANDNIGMVYRLEPDKLNERAIDVFIETVRRRPGTHALIGGGGSLQASFQRAVSKAGLDEAFAFPGYIRYEDLPAFYAQMSLFVAPVWKESFGQVSPFAMSMGLPVVGYDVGALAEIIGNRELLAPPGDSAALAAIIVRLLDDRERRIEIGRANRIRAREMFSVDIMIRRYGQLYQELMTTSP